MDKISELYQYLDRINNDLNPAVSVDDQSKDTIKTEIEEYVFTDEIINGLYDVLSHIMKQNVSHNGIWINGFFGSGKSHFLKYLGFCVNKEYQDAALERLLEAVADRDPLQVPSSKSEVSVSEMRDLSDWLRKATVDIILFNIGAVHNTNADQKEVFTQLVWKQFNKLRGYNSTNLALAQYFEKVLDRAGKLEVFKDRLKNDYGFDWEKDVETLINAMPEMVFELGRELVPNLSVDALVESVSKDKVNVSPEALCKEIKEHVDSKGDKNYRLMFLVDEVSQFLNNQKGLLLQLQEVVTGLHNNCNDQAWVACTAQQDLSQILTNMQILDTEPIWGQIMGRFQVRVSLKGTQTEFITQKRLLEKNASAEILLKNIYEDKKLAIENQFVLPSSFRAFSNADDFIGYYPFVPYQFSLIMKVLDAFGKLRYIDTQARGNERTIMKITHSAAGESLNDPIGKFISFDRFYNAMFKGSLMASGQRSIENANRMILEYEDVDFAQRVVNILFMICNLDTPNRLLFPATTENIVTLLMEDVDTNKAELINRVEKTLAFLDLKHIIRTEKTEQGQDIYCFQSEDEIDAAREIESMQVPNDAMAKVYYDIIKNAFGVSEDRGNREPYCSRNFSIGWSVFGKNYLFNNADVKVDFTIGAAPTGSLVFRPANVMTFDIGPELMADKLLQNDFFWYCQVQRYMALGANSKQRAKTNEAISARAKEVYEKRIVAKFKEMLNKCEILSGDAIISNTNKGSARYKTALHAHLARAYEYAKLAVGDMVPNNMDSLRGRIQERIQPDEYGPLNPMSEAEKLVEQFINSQPMLEVYVSEILRNFSGRPYGWSEYATAYFINELRRRGVRSFKYNNETNIDNKVIAQNLIKDSTKFTVIPATTIPQNLINDFIAAWKKALKLPSAPSAYDPGELFRMCKTTEPNENHSSIGRYLKSFRERRNELSPYPFVSTIDEAISLLDRWSEQRDPKTFFELVINEQEKAKEIMDNCRTVLQFATSNLPQYQQMLQFVQDNNHNFDFITDQTKVLTLKSVAQDSWPFGKLPQYAKLMNEIKKELKAIADEKRRQIKQSYNEVFEELQRIAEENGVTYTVNDAIVITKTQKDDLYVLQHNTDASDYRAEQVKWIMDHKPITPQPPKGENGGVEPGADPDSGEFNPPVPRKTIKMITLKTGSTRVLDSVEAIDEYLSGLRQQLMENLTKCNENEYIMVK